MRRQPIPIRQRSRADQGENDAARHEDHRQDLGTEAEPSHPSNDSTIPVWKLGVIGVNASVRRDWELFGEVHRYASSRSMKPKTSRTTPSPRKSCHIPR